MQDAKHLLGIELDGLRGFFRAIDDGWNLALDANAACGVLVEFSLTGGCCYYFGDRRHNFLSGTVEQCSVVSPRPEDPLPFNISV